MFSKSMIFPTVASTIHPNLNIHYIIIIYKTLPIYYVAYEIDRARPKQKKNADQSDQSKCKSIRLIEMQINPTNRNADQSTNRNVDQSDPPKIMQINLTNRNADQSDQSKRRSIRLIEMQINPTSPNADQSDQ